MQDLESPVTWMESHMSRLMNKLKNDQSADSNPREAPSPMAPLQTSEEGVDGNPDEASSPSPPLQASSTAPTMPASAVTSGGVVSTAATAIAAAASPAAVTEVAAPALPRSARKSVTVKLEKLTVDSPLDSLDAVAWALEEVNASQSNRRRSLVLPGSQPSAAPALEPDPSGSGPPGTPDGRSAPSTPFDGGTSEEFQLTWVEKQVGLLSAHVAQSSSSCADTAIFKELLAVATAFTFADEEAIGLRLQVDALHGLVQSARVASIAPGSLAERKVRDTLLPHNPLPHRIAA